MASIDGLSSGLDTTSIVSQLMQIERLPQDRLVSRRLAVLSTGTAWGQVGAALSALRTAAEKITTTASTGGLGAATTTSSTPGTATATATAGAQTGTHTISVQSLATAGSYGRTVASPTATVGAGTLVLTRGTSDVGVTAATASSAATGTYRLEVRSVQTTQNGGGKVTGSTAEVVLNGVAATVDTSSGSWSLGGLTFSSSSPLTVGSAEVTVARTSAATATVADLAASVNAARGVASASVVTTTDPSTGATTTRLLLSSTSPGTTGAVTSTTSGLTGLGAETTVRAARDASLTLDGLAGIARSSNRVTDLLPGVTVDLVAAGGPETTITVGRDAAAGTADVKALVTALNSVLTTVATNSKYDAATKKSGPLNGDSAARSLTGQLQQVVGDAAGAAATTLGALGLALQRDGTYTLDEAAFSAAMTKDPAATTALVGALGTGLAAYAKSASGPDGVAKRGTASATETAARMQAQVDAMDTRLELTESRLRKQFTALETALGSLRSQGSWLAGQLSSLYAAR